MRNMTPSSKLPATTFDTRCGCGRRMTVKVTMGDPPTFHVIEGHHVCDVWAATCKAVIAEGRERIPR